MLLYQMNISNIDSVYNKPAQYFKKFIISNIKHQERYSLLLLFLNIFIELNYNNHLDQYMPKLLQKYLYHCFLL